MDDVSEKPIPRRLLLARALRLAGAAALAAPVAACGILDRSEDAPGLTIAPAAPTEATPTPTLTASATPTPLVPPVVTLDPPEVGQGETALLEVRQPGATGGSVHVLDQRLPLIRGAEDGALWIVVGAGLLTPLGEQVAKVATRTADGALLSEVEWPFSVVPVERPVDHLTAAPSVTAVLTVEAAETEAALRAYEQFNLFEAFARWNGVMRRPAEGHITTAFGQGRSINGGPVTSQHSGTDIANAAGSPILAAAPGRVAWAGPMPIRGNSVLVDHGAGVVTGYHHLLEIDANPGDIVVAGQRIAKMGSTGFSTGPHLHWEMTIYGVNVDPMTWLTHPFLPKA